MKQTTLDDGESFLSARAVDSMHKMGSRRLLTARIRAGAVAGVCHRSCRNDGLGQRAARGSWWHGLGAKADIASQWCAMPLAQAHGRQGESDLMEQPSRGCMAESCRTRLTRDRLSSQLDGRDLGWRPSLVVSAAARSLSFGASSDGFSRLRSVPRPPA